MSPHIVGEKNYIKKITQELINNMGSPIPFIKEIGAHILLGNGKLLRPLLFILSCKLLDYEKDHVYSLSTVFEYIHVASLLHDDVLDNAETRRNKPSVNNKWGDHVAILEGDYLYSRSLVTAINAGNFRFLKKVISATTDMVEGQLMEIACTNNPNITKEEYMNIIKKKTAALLSAACGCAAIIANKGEKVEKALSEFGLYLGMAFQLIDDILDYTSSEDVFGKPVGKDLKEGKITLPLIYALEEMKTHDRMKVKQILQQREIFDSEYSDIIEMVIKSQGIFNTKKDAFFFTKKAQNALQYFKDSPAKKTLLHLSNYIIDRDH